MGKPKEIKDPKFEKVLKAARAFASALVDEGEFDEEKFHTVAYSALIAIYGEEIVDIIDDVVESEIDDDYDD